MCVYIYICLYLFKNFFYFIFKLTLVGLLCGLDPLGPNNYRISFKCHNMCVGGGGGGGGGDIDTYKLKTCPTGGFAAHL